MHGAHDHERGDERDDGYDRIDGGVRASARRARARIGRVNVGKRVHSWLTASERSGARRPRGAEPFRFLLRSHALDPRSKVIGNASTPWLGRTLIHSPNYRRRSHIRKSVKSTTEGTLVSLSECCVRQTIAAVPPKQVHRKVSVTMGLINST